MNPAPPTVLERVYIVTGEPSGDAHAAAVVRALKALNPGIAFRGMGGDAMEAEGVALVEHVRNTAIMGFAEVVAKIRFIRQLMRRVQDDVDQFSPDRILIVDYPGFNLRLATWAKERGYAVDMYIAPQVWAWKRGRIHRMARDLDRLYVILPFEAAHYEGVDLKVDYVGHPLAEATEDEPHEAEAAWRRRCGLPADGALLALLPGSRPQEIKRMLSGLVEAARLLPEFVPVIAGAPGRSGEDYDTELPVLFGETAALYRWASAGLITSGTATLEAALQGLPQVVAYRTSGLTYRLARWFTEVRFISLVNLVLDREAVPERIQGECTPQALADALRRVCAPDGREKLQQDLAALRNALSKKGAAEAVAKGLSRRGP